MSKPLHPAVPKRQKFVQTERDAHMKWARLAAKNAMAAAVLHQLVALMDRKAAVAISHKTLAKMIGIHLTSVKKGLAVLRKDKWIQQLQMGTTGTVNVYVINSRVAWADVRDNLRLSMFDVRVIVDAEDQSEETMSIEGLQKIPLIHPPEEVLPAGDWPEGETGFLDGLEPVLEGQAEDEEG